MTRLVLFLRMSPYVLALLVLLPAHGAINSGSDGSDGAFNPVSSVVIDLGLAADAAWDTPSPVAGQGVYDAPKWAVVFKYSSVNIPPGVTVRFMNHPSRAPVIWLVQGDVTIDGAVNLDGSAHSGSASTIVEPGPGGFRGGRSFVTNSTSSAGFGPGSGQRANNAQGGSYGSLGQSSAGPTYGNPQIVPLIGGSGGSGDSDFSFGGGAGGGAILIGCNNTITLNGVLQADGGASQTTGGQNDGGAGSGGAIRLVADLVDGSGSLQARGAINGKDGGAGRIRVEANLVTLTGVGSPPYTLDTPSVPPQIFTPVAAPELRITTVAGFAVPTDPHSRFEFPNQDVSFTDPNPITVMIEARNMPTDWNVILRAAPAAGNYITSNATLVGGDQTLSSWSASVTLPGSFSALQVRAAAP